LDIDVDHERAGVARRSMEKLPNYVPTWDAFLKVERLRKCGRCLAEEVTAWRCRPKGRAKLMPEKQDMADRRETEAGG
jgi:hypothetical protein